MPSKRSRPRKHHEQLVLPTPDKNGQFRGGKRRGAGRKPKGERAGSPHKERAEVDPREPQHVTLRVVESVEWLRRRHTYAAIRRAIVVAGRRADFRIVHISVQGNHIHVLSEAETKQALARGMQGFQISAARHLNAEISKRRGAKRTGQVFADRYHVEAIDSVRQVRHALAYVLNNWRRHHQDRSTIGLYEGRIDPYSSGVWFPGWKERTAPIAIPPDFDPPQTSPPQTWLLAEGWRLGKPISVYEVPGPR